MNYMIIELEFVNVELSIIVSKYLNSFNPHVYLHHLIKFIDTDVIIIIICIVKFSIGRIGNTKKRYWDCRAMPSNTRISFPARCSFSMSQVLCI